MNNMEPNSLIIFRYKFKKANKSLKKVGKNFQPEDIHGFRVEIKRLKALFALFSAGLPDDDKIKIPRRFRKMYKVMGEIRIAQVQEDLVLSTLKKLHLKMPFRYMLNIEIEQDKLKKNSERKLNKLKKLKSKKYIKKVPEEINSGMILTFIETKKALLGDLLSTNSLENEPLHQVRKILKTFIYNWSIIKNKFMEGRRHTIGQKKILKTLESKIGDIHDLYISMDRLEENNIKMLLNGEEKDILKNISVEWQKDIKTFRDQIDHLLHLIVPVYNSRQKLL